jgi:hypothetical protein
MSQRRSRAPKQLPDPWLFDTETLLRELDRCRELALQIPFSSPNATHFGINIVVDAIWNLSQHVRFLLHLHRDSQRAFRKQHHTDFTTLESKNHDRPAAARTAPRTRRKVDSKRAARAGRT